MQTAKLIAVLGLIAGLAGQSHAGFKDELKSAAKSAVGEVSQGVSGKNEASTDVISGGAVAPQAMTMEKSQQIVDQATAENVLQLETDNAKDIFKSMIQALSMDLSGIPEEQVKPYKEILSKGENLWAVIPIHLYGTLILSDKNVYAAGSTGDTCWCNNSSVISNYPIGDTPGGPFNLPDERSG